MILEPFAKNPFIQHEKNPDPYENSWGPHFIKNQNTRRDAQSNKWQPQGNSSKPVIVLKKDSEFKPKDNIANNELYRQNSSFKKDERWHKKSTSESIPSISETPKVQQTPPISEQTVSDKKTLVRRLSSSLIKTVKNIF